MLSNPGALSRSFDRATIAAAFSEDLAASGNKCLALTAASRKPDPLTRYGALVSDAPSTAVRDAESIAFPTEVVER